MSLLTSKLSDEDRKKAHELFGVPEQFDEVADLMVHEEEWQVILLMGKEPMTEKELRKLMEKNRLAASPYVLINRMYSRNVLNKVTDADEPTWKISDFYSRYSYYAQFEYYEFGCLPRELIEALYDWQTEIYQSIYLPQVKAKVAGEGVYVHNQTYLTLEEFDKIIDGHHGSIHLVPCNCKSQKYFHDRKLNVCVNMDDGPNSAVVAAVNALVEKFSAQEVRDAVVKGFDLKSLLGITMTYVFKDLLILGGVIDVLPTYFEHLPIPAFLVLVILYAFGTLVAGSSAAAEAFIPLAYTMIPDGGAFLLALLMNVSFASSQLSPTHICTAIISDYFGVTFFATVKKLLPLFLLTVLIACGYYMLLTVVF